MDDATLNNASADPFDVLGIPDDASEQVIRTRYLELVKKFPPDREPDKFRAIQAAYQAARDPLILAQKLIAQCNPDEAPSWESVLQQYAKAPPPMTLDFLLSLGNQVPGFKATPSTQPPIQDSTDIL